MTSHGEGTQQVGVSKGSGSGGLGLSTWAQRPSGSVWQKPFPSQGTVTGRGRREESTRAACPALLAVEEGPADVVASSSRGSPQWANGRDTGPESQHWKGPHAPGKEEANTTHLEGQ